MKACNLITGHRRSVLLLKSRNEITLRCIRQVCYADYWAEPWFQKDTAALQTPGCLRTPSKQRAKHPVFLLWTWRCVAVFRCFRRIWTQSYANGWCFGHGFGVSARSKMPNAESLVLVVDCSAKFRCLKRCSGRTRGETDMVWLSTRFLARTSFEREHHFASTRLPFRDCLATMFHLESILLLILFASDLFIPCCRQDAKHFALFDLVSPCSTRALQSTAKRTREITTCEQDITCNFVTCMLCHEAVTHLLDHLRSHFACIPTRKLPTTISSNVIDAQAAPRKQPILASLIFPCIPGSDNRPRAIVSRGEYTTSSLDDSRG
jgi:hypothetical protein